MNKIVFILLLTIFGALNALSGEKFYYSLYHGASDEWEYQLKSDGTCRKIGESVHGRISYTNYEVDKSYCEPLIVAKKEVERNGSCNEEIVSSTSKNIGGTTETDKLILSSSCLCYREKQVIRGISRIERFYEQREKCNR